MGSAQFSQKKAPTETLSARDDDRLEEQVRTTAMFMPFGQDSSSIAISNSSI